VKTIKIIATTIQNETQKGNHRIGFVIFKRPDCWFFGNTGLIAGKG
jgi:hypothetical protein